MLGSSSHLKAMINIRNSAANPRCTRRRQRICAAALNSGLRCTPKISIQKVDVRAVSAPSTLGNRAEMRAMKKISCTTAGKCPSTMAGNSLSPVAVTPASGAYRCSKPPRNRNSSSTPVSTTVRLSMFFCESRKVRTEMFFCIISWSMPVMAMVMNMPATMCFHTYAGLSGSTVKMRVRPCARMRSRLSRKDRSISRNKNTLQMMRPASMHAVCRVSVQTMVFTPPS